MRHQSARAGSEAPGEATANELVACATPTCRAAGGAFLAGLLPSAILSSSIIEPLIYLITYGWGSYLGLSSAGALPTAGC